MAGVAGGIAGGYGVRLYSIYALGEEKCATGGIPGSGRPLNARFGAG